MSQTEMVASVRGTRVPLVSDIMHTCLTMTRRRVLRISFKDLKKMLVPCSVQEREEAWKRMCALRVNPLPTDAVLFGGATGLIAVPVRGWYLAYEVKLDLARDALITRPVAMMPAREFWQQ